MLLQSGEEWTLWRKRGIRVSSCNIPLRCPAARCLIWYTAPHTHTHTHTKRKSTVIYPECKSNFQVSGWAAHTDLCQPPRSVSAAANRLLLCSGVNSCLGAEARWPGRYVLRVCCSPSPAVPSNLARNFNGYLGALCVQCASLSAEMSSSKTQYILASTSIATAAPPPYYASLVSAQQHSHICWHEFNLLTFNLQIFEKKLPRSHLVFNLRFNLTLWLVGAIQGASLVFLKCNLTKQLDCWDLRLKFGPSWKSPI